MSEIKLTRVQLRALAPHMEARQRAENELRACIADVLADHGLPMETQVEKIDGDKMYTVDAPIAPPHIEPMPRADEAK